MRLILVVRAVLTLEQPDAIQKAAFAAPVRTGYDYHVAKVVEYREVDSSDVFYS